MKQKITVEAWVEGNETRAEVLQSLVSQWHPPDTWPGFDAFDASRIDGLPSHGYFGAVFDGRFVYFVPEMHGGSDFPTHSIVLRLDTHGDFHNPASYEAYDASCTDGLDTRGFYGGAFDGRYVYFIPRQIGLEYYHSRLLRFDTQGAFRDAASWAAFDIREEQSAQGAAFDGRYLYLCPGFSGDPKKEDTPSGKVIRYDTKGDFKSLSSYGTVDITAFLGAEAACFDGGAFDGRHVYFTPIQPGGLIVRHDVQRDFFDPGAWEAFDARPLGYVQAVGMVFDGTHLYFCAYAHDIILRYDIRKDFRDAASWEAFHAENIGGLRTEGFDGGFFDGRFVYFQPFVYRNEPTGYVVFHSNYLRYDTTKPFAHAASWQSVDASQTSGLKTVGHNAGAFDGRFFYAAPWQQGRKADAPDEIIVHGNVLRCDTLGANGTFSLRYCDYGHNGGLVAAVKGPSFLVNTDRGCIQASSANPLPPGKHHLVGSYDGAKIKLHVDGELVAECNAVGRLLQNDLPVTIGSLGDDSGKFRGRILSATILGSVYTDFEITERYRHYLNT